MLRAQDLYNGSIVKSLGSHELRARRRRLLLSVFVLAAAVFAAVLGAASSVLSLGEAAGAGAAAGVAAGVLFYIATRWSAFFLLRRFLIGKLAPSENPQACNLLEGLCLIEGIERPLLYELDNPSINALVLERGSRPAVIVTRGALERLSRLELEALLASAVARIELGEAGLAATSLGLRAALAIFLPPLFNVFDQVFSRTERATWQSDLRAAAITRYPPALISLFKVPEKERGPVFSSYKAARVFRRFAVLPVPEERAATDFLDLEKRLELVADI